MDSFLFILGGFFAGFGFYKYILMPRVFEFIIIGLAGKISLFEINGKTYRVEIDETK